MIYPKQTKTSASEAFLAGINSDQADEHNPFITDNDIFNSTNNIIFSAGVNFPGQLHINSDGSVFSSGAYGLSSNTAFGNQALVNSTVNFGNTAFGALAAQAQSTGTKITAIGALALQASTTSINSTGVGYQCLFSVQSAINTTAVGVLAGQSLVSGIRNNYFGVQAGAAQTSGDNNNVIGASALQNNVSGSNNTVVGGSALPLIAGIPLGNVAIGYNTGSTITSGNYNTIIGASVSTLPATTNNNIILSDGQGNIKYQWNGTFNILNGIIQPTPQLGRAHLNLPIISTPTTLNDGDIWWESNTLTGLKIRIAGATHTITIT